MKDSLTPDIHERIQEDHNWFESLGRKIPGFRGYMEARDRREADQILRETISARLEQARLNLANVHQELSGDIVKAIDFAEPLGRVDTNLMGLIGKIKDAPQGYAGFFSAIKVDNETLEQLYRFDEGLLLQADFIAASVASLQKAVEDDGDIKEAIRTLDKAVKESNTQFAGRQEVLLGLA
jgi:hypothetical protein